MPEARELEKQLRVAAKTGKYIVGRREVLSGVKGSKLLVWSASANVPQKILDECKTLSVPAIKFDGNPVELGHACGIPFRVSVIAVKSSGDADLSTFQKSSDYVAISQVILPTAKVEEKAEEPKKEAAEKPATKRKPKKKATDERVQEKPEKPKKVTKKKSVKVKEE
ncbi:MAG TPA: ribosomal L7Ae/L30e/S12e/Gadd45 family protein [Nitrososphaerales archaeon]|nr:ribosomal L7Ae/L30e/S12e/Gadd45 family protein [Nitrososphaerales archaeon]